MAGWPKNSLATPCFCNFDCPPNTNPYHKYLMRGGGSAFPEFFNGLMLWWRIQTPLLCGYSLEDSDETIVCDVTIKDTTFGGFDHAYTVFANVTSPTATDLFKVEYGWNDADLPFPVRLQPSCDAEFDMDNSALPPDTLLRTPIPDWICTTVQMRAWLAGI